MLICVNLSKSKNVYSRAVKNMRNLTLEVHVLLQNRNTFFLFKNIMWSSPFVWLSILTCVPFLYKTMQKKCKGKTHYSDLKLNLEDLHDMTTIIYKGSKFLLGVPTYNAFPKFCNISRCFISERPKV